MPVAMTKGGSRYYLAYDQVGSLRAVTDASGNLVKRVEYDTFGNILTDSDPLFEVPFGFAGGLHDRDTGLVRFGYRDYDPDTGRWTAKDPILFAGGDTDLYGYCLSDPVNLIDPEGTAVFTGSLAAAALVKAGIVTIGAMGTIIAGGWLSDILFNESSEGDDDPCEDNEKDDPWAMPDDIPDIPTEPVGDLGKPLDKKWLQDQGIEPHDEKKGGSKTDIYKDKAGNIWEVRKPKRGVKKPQPEYIGHIDSFK